MIASTSDFIPEYMLPEDGEGYNNYITSIRPHISDVLDWDPNFFQDFQFTRFDYALAPQNGFSIPAVPLLLTAVWMSQPVVLAVPSALFEPFPDGQSMFNHNTGLLNKPYDLENLKKLVTISQQRSNKNTDFESGINHAVAVVGYDENLYKDHHYYYPGAIIVKNSWNSDRTSNQFIKPLTPEELIDLKKMRYKINSSNAPGYYAIPIQFLYDLTSYPNKNGKTGLSYFTTYSLNFNLFYFQYVKFQNKFKTYKLPFACDNDYFSNYRYSTAARRTIDELAENYKNCYDKDLDKSERRLACENYDNILTPYTNKYSDPESPQNAFNFAKLSSRVGSNFNPINSFYSGMFASYYCGFSETPKIWPYQKHANDRSFVKSIERISKDDDLDAWSKFFFSLDHMKAQDEYQ